MDHTETGESTTYGRAMRVLAVGDTLDELELSALDKARTLFGSSARLEVVRDYEIQTRTPGGFYSQDEIRASDKEYFCHVKVREVIAR